jgi:carboxyl-terminal processing protease
MSVRHWWLVVVLAASAGCTRPRSVASAGPPADLEPGIEAYLTAALDTVRRVSRHAQTDWQALRDSMVRLSQGARQPRDVYPVIDWMLSKVDRHSFLQASRVGAREADLGEGIAYIRVPFWGNTAMQPVLSDTLQNFIRRRETAGSCRWIVDLRANGGGNMWPMLAGIGPLLGDTIVGGSTSSRGKAYWKYKDGVASLVHEDGRVETLVSATSPVMLRRPLPPVAVLVDSSTGSSGEVMAVAFRARPRTRFFGQPTAGVSTTNQGFRLPDGANMVITIGAYVRGDPIIAAALAWLGTQPCND